MGKRWVDFKCGGHTYYHKEDGRPCTFGYCSKVGDYYEYNNQYIHKDKDPPSCKICGFHLNHVGYKD
ncbi:MAG: hypothetical protein ACUBOA_03045 [Candidatus Loosdrechtia sp.]|uniref:hypothetical protein n=1 Tax=Candidatus Loosdrechtia sp. TaxID=3101272 RepID=UPI003A6F0037|nr:MAG: hypothetical protein QY305_13330 [Candidatus Jettenia sp. AMX2]